MAAGDAAAAAGMELVPGSLPANQIDTAENETRDYIATYTQPVRDATAFATEDTLMRRGEGGRVYVGEPTAAGNATTKSYVDGMKTTSASELTSGTLPLARIANFSIPGSKIALGAIDSGQLAEGVEGVIADTNDGKFSTDPYNREITSTRRAAWIQSNGNMGYASSSRHKKQNMRPAALTMEQLRGIPVVLYRYRKQVAAERAGKIDHAPTEIGTIAEDLHALDLWQFVVYEDGKPIAVHYELLALAALSLGQQLADRLDEFEDRLSALEARDE